jgi:hypothetical protein
MCTCQVTSTGRAQTLKTCGGSAAPTLDPLATHPEIRRAYEDDETKRLAARSGEGSRARGASVFAAELERGLSASATTRASTAVRGTTGE